MQLGEQVSALSAQLKSLRQNMKWCDAILKRSWVIAEKQEQLMQQPEHGNKAREAVKRIELRQ